MRAVRRAAGHDDVQVVNGRVRRPQECLPARDALVALVDIAEPREPLDGGRHGVRRSRTTMSTSMIGFAASPGTDVLPMCSTTTEVGDRYAQRRRQTLEEDRPGRVVLRDHDRLGAPSRCAQGSSRPARRPSRSTGRARRPPAQLRRRRRRHPQPRRRRGRDAEGANVAAAPGPRRGVRLTHDVRLGTDPSGERRGDTWAPSLGLGPRDQVDGRGPAHAARAHRRRPRSRRPRG